MYTTPCLFFSECIPYLEFNLFVLLFYGWILNWHSYHTLWATIKWHEWIQYAFLVVVFHCTIAHGVTVNLHFPAKQIIHLHAIKHILTVPDSIHDVVYIHTLIITIKFHNIGQVYMSKWLTAIIVLIHVHYVGIVIVWTIPFQVEHRAREYQTHNTPNWNLNRKIAPRHGLVNTHS